MAQKPSQHRPPNPESLVARYEHGAQNYANAKEVARKSTDTLQAAQAQLASALRTGDPTQSTSPEFPSHLASVCSKLIETVVQKAEGAVSWWTNNYNFAQNLVTNAKTRVMADSDRIDRHRTVQERRLKDAVT